MNRGGRFCAGRNISGFGRLPTFSAGVFPTAITSVEAIVGWSPSPGGPDLIFYSAARITSIQLNVRNFFNKTTGIILNHASETVPRSCIGDPEFMLGPCDHDIK